MCRIFSFYDRLCDYDNGARLSAQKTDGNETDFGGDVTLHVYTDSLKLFERITISTFYLALMTPLLNRNFTHRTQLVATRHDRRVGWSVRCLFWEETVFSSIPKKNLTKFHTTRRLHAICEIKLSDNWESFEPHG